MKDFSLWHTIKQQINNRKCLSIKTGDVWLCNFGLNVGYEIDGKNTDYTRPGLVIRGFGFGGGIVLPLTTSNKTSDFLVSISNKSSVNISQVRYLDARRFKRYIHAIPNESVQHIIIQFTNLFNEKPPR